MSLRNLGAWEVSPIYPSGWAPIAQPSTDSLLTQITRAVTGSAPTGGSILSQVSAAVGGNRFASSWPAAPPTASKTPVLAPSSAAPSTTAGTAPTTTPTGVGWDDARYMQPPALAATAPSSGGGLKTIHLVLAGLGVAALWWFSRKKG